MKHLFTILAAGILLCFATLSFAASGDVANGASAAQPTQATAAQDQGTAPAAGQQCKMCGSKDCQCGAGCQCAKGCKCGAGCKCASGTCQCAKDGKCTANCQCSQKVACVGCTGKSKSGSDSSATPDAATS